MLASNPKGHQSIDEARSAKPVGPNSSRGKILPWWEWAEEQKLRKGNWQLSIKVSGWSWMTSFQMDVSALSILCCTEMVAVLLFFRLHTFIFLSFLAGDTSNTNQRRFSLQNCLYVKSFQVEVLTLQIRCTDHMTNRNQRYSTYGWMHFTAVQQVLLLCIKQNLRTE